VIRLRSVGTRLSLALFAILIPYLRAAGIRFRPRFDFRDTGLGHTLRLGLWTVGFVIVRRQRSEARLKHGLYVGEARQNGREEPIPERRADRNSKRRTGRIYPAAITSSRCKVRAAPSASSGGSRTPTGVDAAECSAGRPPAARQVDRPEHKVAAPRVGSVPCARGRARRVRPCRPA
jgi:hypothetical protein